MHPPANKPFGPRISILRRKLTETGLDAALISKKESIFYYTGLPPQHPTEREAYLLISPHQLLLYHSPFIEVPVNLPAMPMSATQPLTKVFSSFLIHSATIGIETTNLSVSEHERIQAYLPEKSFLPLDTMIAEQRRLKDQSELELLRQAGTIAQQVIRSCRRWLNHNSAVGVTEIEVARKIDYRLRQLGADESAFPTIVAFDHNSAKPHHLPGNTRLQPNSIILIDMGASVHQYKSDLTRTWQRGSTSAHFSQLKTIVHQAYARAKTTAHLPNILASSLDNAARSVIDQAGFADYFIHTTGHGIGLEAHELPHINSTDTTPLQTGSVFTIEPGIYLPHQFGYRHEDTFVMSPAGAIALTA